MNLTNVIVYALANTTRSGSWSDAMPVKDTITHLGIERSTKSRKQISPNITTKLQLGRKTLYALMGAGLHGLNGLPPIVSVKIYVTYVLPRMLSGLEATILTRPEINLLENFHKNTLRQFQNLPKRTGIPPIYLLLGVPPIEAIIDLKYLSLFGSIIRRRGSKIYNLARRQLIMKDVSSYSWFSKITVLIYKYGLPSPHDVITLEPTKNRWKNMCHAAVYKHWSRILQEKSQEKSSLRYTKLPNLEDKKPHLLWRATHSNPRDIRRACIKSKIATGTYLLQANANIWSRNKDSQIGRASCRERV
jgi:hypothetical protein